MPRTMYVSFSKHGVFFIRGIGNKVFKNDYLNCFSLLDCVALTYKWVQYVKHSQPFGTLGYQKLKKEPKTF